MPCLKELYGKSLKDIDFNILKPGMKVERRQNCTSWQYIAGEIQEVWPELDMFKIKWFSHNGQTNKVTKGSIVREAVLVKEFVGH